jgi:hypothetical protein
VLPSSRAHGRVSTLEALTARRVADVFTHQPLFLGATRLFGRGTSMHAGMSTLMAEAFAISQLPAPLRRANEVSWVLRETLFQTLCASRLAAPSPAALASRLGLAYAGRRCDGSSGFRR